MNPNREQSQVINFFKNSNILITGGTGFLGRVLVSKLLRSCKSLNRIYLILRVKKGKNPFLRCVELWNDPLFSDLKNIFPGLENKITCISGDCQLPDLGLSADDRHLLIKEVTHVFHVAATVKFDEKLKAALTTNVRGINEMIKLCRCCQQLKSVVYVSSAYAYCIRDRVEEIIHDIPFRAEDILYMVENLNSDQLERIKAGLIAPWPNTYNFSKAIAEDIIKENGKGIPIGIFRPSIVIGTSEEPISGWTDNLYGPAGVVAGVGCGILRVLRVNTELRADVVPVDMTVNALICTAWDIHSEYNPNKNIKDIMSNNEQKVVNTPQTSKPPVYNFVTSSINPLTWNDYLKSSMKFGMEIPPVKAVWYITLTTTESETLYKFLILLCHYLPALFVDGMLKLIGKNTRMLKIYQRIHKFSRVISYFTMRQWIFENGNTEKLWSKLGEVDKNEFNFDMKTLNWNSYFQRTIVGIRKYLFLDNESTIPFARKKMLFLLLCHRLLQMGVAIFGIWIGYFIINEIYSAVEAVDKAGINLQ